MKLIPTIIFSIFGFLCSAQASLSIKDDGQTSSIIAPFSNSEHILKIWLKEKRRNLLARKIRAKHQAEEVRREEEIRQAYAAKHREEQQEAIKQFLQTAALSSFNSRHHYQPDEGELSIQKYAALHFTDETKAARKKRNQIIGCTTSLNQQQELVCDTDFGTVTVAYAEFRRLLPRWRKPIYTGQELKFHFNDDRQIIKLQVAPRGIRHTADLLWLGLNTANDTDYTFQIMDFTHYQHGNRHPKTILCRLLSAPAARFQEPALQGTDQPPLLTLKGVTLLKGELFYIDAGVFSQETYLDPERQNQLKYQVFQAPLEDPNLAIIKEFQYPPRHAYARISTLKEVVE